jgi:hypothetical protein
MPATGSEVVYASKAVSGRAWATPFILVAALTVVLVISDLPDLDSTSVVAPVGASSPVLAVWLLALWSMNRYGAITLTPETLRVGRDRVPVADIEPQWVHMLAHRADPTLAQRLATSATTVQLPGDAQVDNERGRILGGAFGTTLGGDLVTLELRGDGLRRNERVSVPTNDRRGLLRGLVTALEAS